MVNKYMHSKLMMLKVFYTNRPLMTGQCGGGGGGGEEAESVSNPI